MTSDFVGPSVQWVVIGLLTSLIETVEILEEELKAYYKIYYYSVSDQQKKELKECLPLFMV